MSIKRQAKQGSFNIRLLKAVTSKTIAIVLLLCIMVTLIPLTTAMETDVESTNEPPETNVFPFSQQEGEEPKEPDNPGNTEEMQTTSMQVHLIDEFVIRLYKIVLNRPSPGPAEVAYWSNYLMAGMPGSTVAHHFFFSTEFINRRLTNSEFVDALYFALLDRPSDSHGKTYWVNQLDRGWMREDIFAGFVNSTEFNALCFHYDIVRVPYTPPPGGGIQAFVTRLYVVTLGRSQPPAQSEIDYWTNQITINGMPGISVAYGFFFSAEFRNRGLTDAEYVNTLYDTLFDRNPSTSERAYWVDRLNDGWPRENIYAGFVNSAEFAAICTQFGIPRGTPYTPPPGGGHRAYVTRLYKVVLNRQSPSESEISYWVYLMMVNGMSGTAVAYSFFFSPELIGQNLSNTAFVNMLYIALLNRNPSNAERDNWVNWLDNGWPREYVFSGIVNSTEFATLCSSYEIQRGTYSTPLQIMVSSYVNRLYMGALGRTQAPTQAELNSWTNSIIRGNHTAASAAYAFYFGDEISNQLLSNYEFVIRLFRGLYAREPAREEWVYWENRLNTDSTRQRIFSELINTNEFATICSIYGIPRGSVPSTEITMQGNDMVAKVWNEIVKAHFAGISDRSEHVAGIVANVVVECGQNMCPFQQQLNSPQGGLGLLQWTGTRRTSMETFMWTQHGISRADFEAERNKHLTMICANPLTNHPHALLDKVLEAQVQFMFHELNTTNAEYLRYISSPTNQVAHAGAEAYAELFCALYLRPGAGTGALDDIHDAGVRNARLNSSHNTGANLGRVSFNQLHLRRSLAQQVYNRSIG